jgi:hypothetical protein
MRNKIITYMEMCQKEGAQLQKGMNFRLRGKHSIFLMSVRENAPYADRVLEDGEVLIYEGHDIPRTAGSGYPKHVDQPEFTSTGKLTENGKFHRAAQDFVGGKKGPDIVRVYEKLKKGIWSDNGAFHLVDSWVENDEKRKVFKFQLNAIDDLEENEEAVAETGAEYKHARVIPASVKQEVFKRDRGKCQVCGAADEIHFDHVLPYSKGGTSLKADNIQILCARHNLEKGAKIQ